MPPTSSYEYVEDTGDCSSIISSFSSYNRLQWEVRLDEFPLLITKLGEFHLLPLHDLICRRGLNSSEIRSRINISIKIDYAMFWLFHIEILNICMPENWAANYT